MLTLHLQVSLSTSDEMDVVDALRSKEDSSLLSYDAFLAFLGSVREEGESDGKTPEPSAPSKLSTSGVGSSTAKSTRERSVDVEESKTPSARRQRVANLSPRFTDACRQIFRDGAQCTVCACVIRSVHEIRNACAGAGKVTQESIMSTFKTYSDDPEDDRSPTVKKISQAGFKRALQKLKVREALCVAVLLLRMPLCSRLPGGVP